MSDGARQLAAARRDHVVQWYAHEAELVDSVGKYVVDGVRSGGVALVVATPEHWAAFAERVGAAGIDVASALATGAIVAMDARQTLDRFLVGHRADPERFQDAIGGPIQQAGRAGRPVYAYGEMVDLLWQAGLVSVALDVEELWNELSRQYPFSLFCAYHSELWPDGREAAAFREVCRLHSAVFSPPTEVLGLGPEWAVEASRNFEPDVHSPRDARRFAAACMQAWADDELIDDTLLVVTELATNAVVHARSAFTVVITGLEEGVRVSVLDASPVLPVGHTASLASFSGRGLGLVAAVATAWGADPQEVGKVVWAELARSKGSRRSVAEGFMS